MPSKGDYKTVQCPTLKLNTGQQMPIVGLGTWKAEPGVVGEAVKTALINGYRHIDCAAAYKNQDEVGNAFTEIFKDGVVKREDVWITSKCFNDTHAAADVQKACEKTISELKCEYLDLYLVHWPVTNVNEVPEVTPPIKETWEAMEKLQDQGLVKAIGLSNFSVKKTTDVLNYARIKPAVQQVEIHPYWRNDALVEFCKQQNIVLTAYSPLGSPDSLSMMGRDKTVPVLLENKELNAIAKKLGKNAGQVAIRWHVQHQIAVIPKSVSKDRIIGNLDVLDWTIPDEDMKILDTLDFQARMLDGASVASINPKGPYKTLDELWDGELSDFNRQEYAKSKSK